MTTTARTRRANFSNEEVANFTGWQPPMVNDYQGILQDAFDAVAEIAELEGRVEQNEQDIQALDVRVTTNEGDIANNTQDISELEHRVWGESPPTAYQEAGAAYVVGSRVVNPATGNNNYYICREPIADPAGPFDVSKWLRKSVIDNLSIELYRQLSHVVGMSINFDGAAANGPANVNRSKNVASCNRTAQGVYEITFQQSSFLGENLISSNFYTMRSWVIPGTGTSDSYEVDVIVTAPNIVTARVYQIVNSGTMPQRNPYDHTNGEVEIMFYTDLSGGLLPPP